MAVTATFQNSSKNATGYQWSFGDGFASTAASPTHTYINAGAYIVRLTATGPGGLSTNEQVLSVQGGSVVTFLATNNQDTLTDDNLNPLILPQ